MNQNICDVVIKGLAAALRKRYPGLRIEGHPHIHRDWPLLRARALLIINDWASQHGLHMEVSGSDDVVIHVFLRVMTNGNITKSKHWLTIDLMRPNSLDYLERQITRKLHDLSGLWTNRADKENLGQPNSTCH